MSIDATRYISGCHNVRLVFLSIFCAKLKIMELLYKAAEVSRLAGFEKPWMLGHLVREEIFVRCGIQNRKHGNVRKYNFTDLLILRTINRMLALGMRPVRIKSVIAQLSKIEKLSSSREAAEELVRQFGVRIFVTGDTAYLVTTDEEIVSLSQSGQLAFAFMVDLKSSLGDVIDIAKRYEDQRSGYLKLDIPMLDTMCLEAGI